MSLHKWKPIDCLNVINNLFKQTVSKRSEDKHTFGCAHENQI